MRHAEIRERMGRSQGVMSFAPKFEERKQDETLKRERCARRDTWDLAKDVYKLKKDEQYIVLCYHACLMPAHFFEKFAHDFGASLHMLRKRDLRSGELETRRSKNPITVVTTSGEVQTNEKAQIYVHDLDLFDTVHLLEDTIAVLKEHGYTHQWDNGQKQHLFKDGNKILCKTENYVPLMVTGLISNSSTDSTSTSLPQDYSVHPAKFQRNEEAAGNCSDGFHEGLEEITDSLEDAEVTTPANPSHDADLKRPMQDAPKKHNIETHLP